MITEKDKLEVEKIKKFIEISSMKEDKEFGLIHNYDMWNWISLLEKMVSNLEKAPFSYKQDNWYTVECSECGWWGSGELLDGGGQIADTGDYSDTYCPVCGNIDVYEK